MPLPVVRRALKLLELLMGPTAFATWDEAELLEISMTSRHGTRDAERLGVRAEADARGARRRLAATLSQRRAPRRPRQRLLELRGQRQQRVLARRPADQLDAGRQPVVAVIQRQRDRRAAR